MVSMFLTCSLRWNSSPYLQQEKTREHAAPQRLRTPHASAGGSQSPLRPRSKRGKPPSKLRSQQNKVLADEGCRSDGNNPRDRDSGPGPGTILFGDQSPKIGPLGWMNISQDPRLLVSSIPSRVVGYRTSIALYSIRKGQMLLFNDR